jgi:hypothetical protein
MALEVPSAGAGSRYVDWPAVFAGGLAAAAILFVLLTAGGSIGLSLVSPYAYQSYSRTVASLATGWVIAVSIGSLLVGGYIAGRMRSAWGEGVSTEVVFRDGVHGLLVWALSVVAGALLGLLAAGAAATTGAELGNAAVHASDSNSVLALSVDGLLRAPTTASPQTATTMTVPSDVRPEVTRLLARAGATKQLSDPDRKYLADLVAQRSGIPPAEAAKRVNDAYADALKAGDNARKVSVLAGLVTATALLIGLVAAWYAAQRGGYHRDHNIPARFVMRRSMPDLRK